MTQDNRARTLLHGIKSQLSEATDLVDAVIASKPSAQDVLVNEIAWVTALNVADALLDQLVRATTHGRIKVDYDTRTGSTMYRQVVRNADREMQCDCCGARDETLYAFMIVRHGKVAEVPGRFCCYDCLYEHREIQAARREVETGVSSE